MSEARDTGELLAVPKDQQLEVDDYVAEEVNDDEFQDLSWVPEGDYVELSTATDDEVIDQDGDDL